MLSLSLQVRCVVRFQFWLSKIFLASNWQISRGGTQIFWLDWRQGRFTLFKMFQLWENFLRYNAMRLNWSYCWGFILNAYLMFKSHMITKCLHWRSVHKSLKFTLCNRWEASCAILTMKPAKTFPEIDAVCKYKAGSSLSVGWNSSSSKVIQKNTFLKFWKAILRAFVEKKRVYTSVLSSLLRFKIS